MKVLQFIKRYYLEILLFFVAFLAGIVVSALVEFNREIPDIHQLEHIEQGRITKVFTSDSILIKQFYLQKREIANFFEIPDNLKNAVIAIEDQRFYKHWGIDLIRLVKAIMVDIIKLKKAQGASTITQQLARNLYLSQKKTISRKIKEMLTAIKIEKIYSKDEILTLYLNHIYLGPGIYGVKSAAKYYFNKELQDLTLAECAFLAGIIQSPGYYNPNRYAKRAFWRRNLVLYYMYNLGFIDKNTYILAKKEPLPVLKKEEEEKVGEYYVEYIRQYILNNYGYDYLYKGGLSIYLGMNYNIQKTFEYYTILNLNKKQKEKITPDLDLSNYNTDSLLNLPDSLKEKILQAAGIIIDLRTGYVVAMVGGRDFGFNSFNRAIQAKRQPGSAFKPFLYAAALDNGYTPASLILDQPIAVQVSNDELWVPNNDDKRVGGFITLREALKLSKNLVSIRLIGKIKPTTVVFYAHQLGIKSHLNPYTSLAIGTSELSLAEITAAYTPFATNGYYVKPKYIIKIIDRDGTVLEDNSYLDKKLVLQPGIAFIMSSMMKSVINSGTAWRARAMGLKYPAVAGKTGTTDDYTDAWFIGFSPYYVCGVWVGLDNHKSMGHGASGARMALPIWTDIMKYLHKDLPQIDFIQPADVVKKEVCSKSHLLARPTCPQTYKEYFLKDNLPPPCNIHGNFKKDESENINDFDIED